MHREMEDHLRNIIIPFWKKWKDEEYGGYYGYVGTDIKADRTAEKGCILNSRILWFFSNAYLLLGEENLKEYADHAYAFMKNRCMDMEEGLSMEEVQFMEEVQSMEKAHSMEGYPIKMRGLFWSVDYQGNPSDTTKHTYNQAFAIYALSSYYDAFRNPEALKMAEALFWLIETKCVDRYGYIEAQSREFGKADNDKLSENGVMADRTMNTLLHVFEAYVEFYRVSRKQEAAERIRLILDTVADKIYNPVLGRQEVFFDRAMNSLIDLHSFGHDIETAWLVDAGLSVLGDESYTNKLSPITERLEQNVYEKAYDGRSLANESERGKVDQTRIWWVEAEAVVGFYNAWQKHPERIWFKEAAESIWSFIRTHLVDKREGSEWFWCTDQEGNPALEKPLVEPWKCPYHNGRMCMEIIRRCRDAS